MSESITDLEFLLRAANFEGGNSAVSAFSQAAREAVELKAQELKAKLEINLKVTQIRLEKLKPENLAATADSRGEEV